MTETESCQLRRRRFCLMLAHVLAHNALEQGSRNIGLVVSKVVPKADLTCARRQHLHGFHLVDLFMCLDEHEAGLIIPKAAR